MNEFVYEMILKNCSDTTVFTPEMLCYLIAFMLMLEFFGGIFGLFAKTMDKVGNKK